MAEIPPGLTGAPVKSLVTGCAPGTSLYGAFGLFGLAVFTVPGGVVLGGVGAAGLGAAGLEPLNKFFIV